MFVFVIDNINGLYEAGRRFPTKEAFYSNNYTFPDLGLYDPRVYD